MRWPWHKRKWNVGVWSLHQEQRVVSRSTIEARSAKKALKIATTLVAAAYPRGAEHHIDVWEAS